MTARPNIDSVKAILVDALREAHHPEDSSYCVGPHFISGYFDADKLAATIIERFHQHYELQAHKAGESIGFLNPGATWRLRSVSGGAGQ